jgi:uncharacterized protein with ParB-like and HNH nuclease domain
MNLIKTDIRSKLYINILQNIVRISMHDSDEHSFKFEEVFSKWAAKKARRSKWAAKKARRILM